MEHWLPFYYETLETLFDYLPGAAVSFDHQAEEARAHRLESIADFYAARRTISVFDSLSTGRGLDTFRVWSWRKSITSFATSGRR